MKANIRILQYSTGQWLTEEEDVERAIEEIMSGSKDYSYNKDMVASYRRYQKYLGN